MNRLFPIAVLAVLAFSVPVSAGEAKETAGLNFNRLTAGNHPRLFITDKDMKAIKKEVSFGSNPYILELHGAMMAAADAYGMADSPIEYKPVNGIPTALDPVRKTMRRIISASYAYRYTKDKEYLRHVEDDLNLYCDIYPSWGGSWAPIIDCEMLMTVAVAYDWLYKDLKPATKEKIAARIKETGMDAYLSDKMRPGKGHNRNQVCTAALVTCGLGLYELYPEEAVAIIEKAIPQNRETVGVLYSPDGATPESPSYWNYGTEWQCMLNFVCEDLLGTDFGLNSVPGFEKSADFRNFTISNAEVGYFNYGDCSLRPSASTALWYYAMRLNQPDVLYRDVEMLADKKGKKQYSGNRTLFLAIACAHRLGSKFTVNRPPHTARIFAGRGETPVVIGRTGWGQKDAFFGIKGGSPRTSHGHMDEGTFVFESYGVRWATDYPHKAYQRYRNIFKKLGVKEGGKNQNDYHYYLFHINNRQHNTLTVNDHRQVVAATSPLVDSFDRDGRIGGTIDLSPSYANDLEGAVRTAAIVGEGDFEVVDVLTTKEGVPAHVRFTWLTRVEPEVTADGIILKKNGITMKLHTDAPGAVYKEWSNDPKDYDTPTAPYESGFDGYYFCGYEYDLSAGQKCEITTKLTKI